MWTYEHSIETDASAAQLWRLYSDVSTWPRWDGGLDRITINGPFEAGATGEMKFVGQDPLPYTLVAVDPDRSFIDETDMGDIVIRFEHRLAPKGSATVVTTRVAISGPKADELGPKLGPMITADVPDQLASLARLALGSNVRG
ncbi:MAG: SRPBCC family protein [Chloroflexota bacterium]